jgi:hypothetical protein
MVAAVLDALVRNPRFRCHFAHETVNLFASTAPLDAQGHAHRNGQDARDDGGRDLAKFRKAEGDRFTVVDALLELFRRHALEQALVMAAPRAHDPVFRAYVLKHGENLLLVPIIEMDGRADVRGIEDGGDLLFKGNQIVDAKGCDGHRKKGGGAAISSRDRRR